MDGRFERAYTRTPPRGFGTGMIGEAQVAAAGEVTNQSLGFSSADNDGAWFTFRNLSDSEGVTIRFGTAGVGVSVAQDDAIGPGGVEEWWCSASQDTHFSKAGGEMKFYRSSR